MRLDHVERVNHSDDRVERAVIDRHAAVSGLGDLRCQSVRVDAIGKREDVGPRYHDLADDLLGELDDAADDRDLIAFANAFQLALARGMSWPKSTTVPANRMAFLTTSTP